MNHPYICYFKNIKDKELTEYKLNIEKCDYCTGFQGYGTCKNFISNKELENKQGIERLLRMTK